MIWSSETLNSRKDVNSAFSNVLKTQKRVQFHQGIDRIRFRSSKSLGVVVVVADDEVVVVDE